MRNRKIVQKRLWLLTAFFTAAIVALCARIAFLQLVDDDFLSVMASGQYLTELTEAAQRGGIYDRFGEEITGGENNRFSRNMDARRSESIEGSTVSGKVKTAAGRRQRLKKSTARFP